MHRLDPLLRPRSIAVVGASSREGAVGRQTLENLMAGGFPGAIYPVNPGRSQVLGLPCFSTFSALPKTVDHAVFCIADTQLEPALDAAIEHGIQAATIMSNLVLEDDQAPLLQDRIAERIRQSGILLCGANGMGFYNFHDGVWVCGFDTRHNHPRGGNVALISQSGAGMSGIIDCEERIEFNLAVSTGQELAVGMHDYLDFALDLPGTRAIGLFMETARDPKALISAFEKARRLNIPIVVLKVGRTELAARLAVSHSGAIAGRDASYQAVFDCHGVQRVNDMDELTTALIMFAQPHPVGPGALAAIHDSGGERQHLIDLADELEVPLARVSSATEAQLQSILDPGLPAVNPLDAWGRGGPDADRLMERAFAALMSDPDSALGAVVHDRAPLGHIYREYIGYLRQGHAASGKPVFLVANRQGTGADPAVIETTREGFPVLDGLRSFLVGARCLLNFRDAMIRPRHAPERPDPKIIQHWRKRLAADVALDEFEAGQLLSDFGVPVASSQKISSLKAALGAAEHIGFPVALKTLEPGIHHKTAVGGVFLDIENAKALEEAYTKLEASLGPSALVSRMVTETGLELMLGMIRDEQFGPVVLLGFGGTQVEALADVKTALAPFSAHDARGLLDQLRLRNLLGPARGQPAAAIGQFCLAAERFSVMVDCLAHELHEVDVNPLIVNAQGCVAVDALIVGRTPDTPKTITTRNTQ